MISKFALLLIVSLYAFHSVAQTKVVTLSGMVKDKIGHTPLPYVNIIVASAKDSTFIAGTISNEEGRFSLSGINPGNYYVELSFVGFQTSRQPLYVGTLSDFLDIATIELTETTTSLNSFVSSVSSMVAMSKKSERVPTYSGCLEV